MSSKFTHFLGHHPREPEPLEKCSWKNDSPQRLDSRPSLLPAHNTASMPHQLPPEAAGRSDLCRLPRFKWIILPVLVAVASGFPEKPERTPGRAEGSRNLCLLLRPHWTSLRPPAGNQVLGPGEGLGGFPRLQPPFLPRPWLPLGRQLGAKETTADAERLSRG